MWKEFAVRAVCPTILTVTRAAGQQLLRAAATATELFSAATLRRRVHRRVRPFKELSGCVLVDKT